MSRQRPVIGVIGNHYELDGRYPVHATGLINTKAVAEVADCLPLMIPTDPSLVSVSEILDLCDGVLFTGGQPNVHPEEYGQEATPAHGPFDRNRDAIVLPLIKEMLRRGQPLLGICRGFQELNVALGGSLHPEIREIEGRMNHRMPKGRPIEEQFAHRHKVTFTKSGRFHQLIGDEVVMTNSLHGQGIDRPGSKIVIDGTADDGTPEAIYIQDAPGFCLAVQWHPEWNASQDAVSRPLFQAFGRAARQWDRGH